MNEFLLCLKVFFLTPLSWATIGLFIITYLIERKKEYGKNTVFKLQ